MELVSKISDLAGTDDADLFREFEGMLIEEVAAQL
jgi:hypothetical protein